MIRLFFLILFAASGSLSVGAVDPDFLKGAVYDAVSGEPLAGVIVKATGGFTSTDTKGRFELKIKATTDSVSFRRMGYETISLPVSADFSDVRLSQKTTVLRDVIVEAPDIYAKGDTLVFNVARYANAQDNAIIDVIKRLPGIKVEEDGTIKYQGKPINKFYLDGNDFIGGRYGLATNNISYKDVKAVEVMEHHQPVKALEGIEFPEEAGINLKLKEDARGKWVGVAKASLGMQPFLYAGSLFTMRMAPKIQNMFTLKADNTGWNPANEIQDHDMDVMFSSDYSSSLWPEYISADFINAPLTEKRTRDNLSCLADAISSWKKGDTSMRLKFDYIGDRLDYNSGLTTDYFSNDIPIFYQSNSLRTNCHDLSAQFFSETNKRGYYLKDKLTLNGVWENSLADITGSFILSQKVDRRKFSAVNDLKLVKRNEKRIFNLTSRNSFYHRPDGLNVMGEAGAEQTVGATDFRSTTETRIGRITRFWKYYLTAGLDIDWHRMDFHLTGFGSFDNRETYDAFLSNVYALPQVDYIRGGWRLSLGVPLKWKHISLIGHHDYINVAPWINARRQLTAKSEVSASLSYYLGSPQAYLNIDAPVLADYRNLFIAFNPDKYTHDASAKVSYSYRNPMKSLFVNLSASYNYHHAYLMSNQLFIDDFIISTYSDQLHHNDTWKIAGGLSKGLGHSKMVVGADMEVSLATASSMRDNLVIPYKQTRAALKPYFKGSILKWLSANYEAEYGFTRLQVRKENADYHSFRHNLFITILPSDAVDLTAGVEQYFNKFQEGKSAKLCLIDASVAWRVSGRVRLSLTLNNILDRRRYEYESYGALSRTTHSFSIRPRSIIASFQLTL